ncbi:MAG: hypothetical protein GXP42_03215 [Chloroflexi bacterium]|nr:hypothetical protein [Chloroflexota bacterium]
MQRITQPRLPLFFLAAFLLILLGSCGPATGPMATAQSAPPPIIDMRAARFAWDDPAITPYRGDRIVDITASPTTMTLEVSAEVESALGLYAVDPLINPQLDGAALITKMPTESAFVIQPDGNAWFTYSDLFDPFWREREPEWKEEIIDGATMRLDRLDDDAVTAKIVRDADLSLMRDALYVLDEEQQIHFYWSGAAQYCFPFGRPVRSFTLTDPTGERKTTLETAVGFRIRISSGGDDWQTLWTASEEGLQQPDVNLPEAFQGAQTLCLRFESGEDMAIFRSLYLTVGFEAQALAATFTRFTPDQRIIQFTDDAASSHRGILFWDDPAITHSPTSIAYEENIVIDETANKLSIRFPQQTLIEFHRAGWDKVGGIKRVVVGRQTLLEAPPAAGWTPIGAFTMLNGDPAPHPPYDNWNDHRDHYMSTGSWKTTWERTQRNLSLADAGFQSATVEGNEVILTWRITDRGKTGQLALILSNGNMDLAGTNFGGVSIQVSVSGEALYRAERFRLNFPLRMNRGDWDIAQRFRKLTEAPHSFQSPARAPVSNWFTQSQSFAFRSGPGRTALALFDRPIEARVRLSDESGRHVYEFDLPLGMGETRETPRLFWLLAPLGASNRWAANDIWAQIFDALKDGYSRDAGVVISRPVPSVVWNAPSEAEMAAAIEHFRETGQYPGPGQGWFDRFAEEQLPRAVAAGVRNLIIQPPWESDAERPPDSLNSGHAPRDFTISNMWGGEDALARLVNEAHANDVQITLWYPSSFSMYSTIAVTHTNWLAWEISGEPLDGGWRDVVAADLRSDYRQYAIDKITALHNSVPFDGLWFDSWPGLAVLTDYADPQPAPTLDEAISLQQAYSNLGLDHILIEGLGPLGRPDAYGDYESYADPPDPNPTQVRELERLRNHEYLLHRMGAGTYIDMAIYHRALASGGLLNIANFDEIDALSENDREWLRRVNLEHRQAVERMDQRKLLVADNRWLGVAWQDDDADEMVIYAFESFRLRLDEPLCARDLSAGTWTRIDDELPAQPWRTYLLRPLEGCGVMYLPLLVARE